MKSPQPKTASPPTVRLYVEAPLSDGARIGLSAMQANYLGTVMRLKPGDGLLVFNGRQGEWSAVIAQMRRGGGALIAETRVRAQSTGPDVHYLFAPLKRAKLDYIVQKAVEMGASAIRPVITRRTIAERVNLDRMRANAIEAAEQCGILHLPELHEPEPLDRAIARWDASRTLIFCDEAGAAGSPLAVLGAIAPGPVAVLIGPEGGFDPTERDMLLARPFVRALRLGPRILRADTAAVAALALVNATLGDWSGV
jgi:16S rRNA (uracil1498-N3)-methyltransferase